MWACGELKLQSLTRPPENTSKNKTALRHEENACGLGVSCGRTYRPQLALGPARGAAIVREMPLHLVPLFIHASTIAAPLKHHGSTGHSYSNEVISYTPYREVRPKTCKKKMGLINSQRCPTSYENNDNMSNLQGGRVETLQEKRASSLLNESLAENGKYTIIGEPGRQEASVIQSARLATNRCRASFRDAVLTVIAPRVTPSPFTARSEWNWLMPVEKHSLYDHHASCLCQSGGRYRGGGRLDRGAWVAIRNWVLGSISSVWLRAQAARIPDDIAGIPIGARVFST